jgi:hypothetical protein
MLQQAVNGLDQLWTWLIYEASVHPFLMLGIAIIIVSAWLMYKAEVRTR